MIKNIKVTNSRGEMIILELRSPRSSGLFIRRIDGLGPSKVDVNMGEALYEDGSYYNSSRVTNRNLVFDLGFLDDGTETVEEIRLKTYRFFPSKKPITIEVETDTRIVQTVGYLESNEPDIFSKDEGTQISIECPSAHFLDKNIITTAIGNTSGGFEFPFSNESLSVPLLEFAKIYSTTQMNVKYTGDSPVGIVLVFDFTGSVNIPVVSNATTGTFMLIDSGWILQLTGSDFIAGDKLTVSTVRGNRYVRLLRGGTTYNVLNAFYATSDWFTIEKGDNVFFYNANAGAANMKVTIMHQPIYDGV